ncbi:class II aldolase/adducin family protein [Lapillicoccus sp.]|uniref:class II aldolase/adducin family protein n=1 Tax=Lapillicoccus sp. TaxID=1909287 RepID=UPI0039835210
MLLLEHRESVVRACRDLVGTGLVRGTSGNVSVRDRDTGLVAITPSGTAYASMTPHDVVVVTLDGEVVEGLLEPTTEAGMHLAIYRARPEVYAVVHTHSPFATTFAALREPLPATHYILARAAAVVRVTPYERYGTPEIAAACVATLGTDCGVLLANHGVVAVGPQLDSAMAVAEAIEYTAEITWRARAIGTPVVLDDAQMAAVAGAFSTYGRATRRPTDQ